MIFHHSKDIFCHLRMDLMFSGHVHAYERTKRVDGVQYFVVGHGGNSDPWKHFKFPWVSGKL